MKKQLFFFILLFLFFANVQYPSIAWAAPAVKAGEVFDDLDGDGKYLGSSYRDNYYLDIEKTDVFEAGDYMLNQIANALFSVIRNLGYVVSVFFYYVMIFDVSQVFSGQIDAIQTNLKSSIFDTFFILAFSASAWNLMKRVGKRDLSGLLSEIAKILCIFVLAAFVVTNSAIALSATTSITKDISISALMNINQQGGSDIENYAASASGMIWTSLVHSPWKSLEFEGAENVDESDVESFLSDANKPGTENRVTLVENYRGQSPNAMLKTMGVGRIGFLIVYLIPFLVKSGIYMFMAVLQLAFQVIAVFYILLAPVILLLALVPAFGGLDLVTLWLKKILETQVMMLIITFIIGVIISLDNFLYGMAGEFGWFIVIFMETLVALIVVTNYKSILGGISKMTKGVRNSGAVRAQLNRSPDPFGALGSGNGIKNLSPIKQYTRHSNGNPGSGSGSGSAPRINTPNNSYTSSNQPNGYNNPSANSTPPPPSNTAPYPPTRYSGANMPKTSSTKNNPAPPSGHTGYNHSHASKPTQNSITPNAAPESGVNSPKKTVNRPYSSQRTKERRNNKQQAPDGTTVNSSGKIINVSNMQRKHQPNTEPTERLENQSQYRYRVSSKNASYEPTGSHGESANTPADTKNYSENSSASERPRSSKPKENIDKQKTTIPEPATVSSPTYSHKLTVDTQDSNTQVQRPKSSVPEKAKHKNPDILAPAKPGNESRASIHPENTPNSSIPEHPNLERPKLTSRKIEPSLESGDSQDSNNKRSSRMKARMKTSNKAPNAKKAAVYRVNKDNKQQTSAYKTQASL